MAYRDLSLQASVGGASTGPDIRTPTDLSELHLPIATRPGTLHNGLTGVLPQWRSHGVALALKLAAARAALGRGFTHSRTGNHSVNRPMLAVNERLGFMREGARVTLRREVQMRHCSR